MEVVRALYVLIDKKEKKVLIVLILTMLVGATMETLSISIILPYVMILANPSQIEANQHIKYVYDWFSTSSLNDFFFIVTVALMFVFLIKNIFLYFLNLSQNYFVDANRFQFTSRLFGQIIQRPYAYFVDSNSGKMLSLLTSNVVRMYNLILAGLQVITEIMIAVFITGLLFVVSPTIALSIFILFLIVIVILHKAIKPKLLKLGKESNDYYVRMLKAITQVFGGIKEVKSFNRESFFLDIFFDYGKRNVKTDRSKHKYALLTKPILELACVWSVLLAVMILISRGQAFDTMIAELSVFAVVAIRLLPSSSRINANLNTIAYNAPFVFELRDLLQGQTTLNDRFTINSGQGPTSPPIKIQTEIKLSDVTFSYAEDASPILDHTNFTIQINQSLGVIGPSGEGKTTMVDLLLGLFTPNSGQVLVDGRDIHENIASWLDQIGYIPQFIFLLDDTIANNVIFGHENNDESRIWQVLQEAELASFVKGLQQGLHTEIGERGVKLSGGQRQRLGIARALYHDPRILIFDEATSSLDHRTEAAIMDNIYRLKAEKTLIIVTHRLNTVKNCDKICEIQDKGIKDITNHFKEKYPN